ncbi:MAG: DUF5658 family protein [Gammaproteobacteria bacterium]|nr:DUF5658 family protein [Gammaproteobacteria bacterium]
MDQPLRPPGNLRRNGPDRRQKTLLALWRGSFQRRRRGPRRATDRGIAAVDWHHPQWLAVALLILLLSVSDAVLTLTLVSLGASELNPIMEPLVLGNGRAFAWWKWFLTSAGVVTLVVLARLRAFGGFPIGAILYAILVGYVLLIGYELWLVDYITSRPMP